MPRLAITSSFRREIEAAQPSGLERIYGEVDRPQFRRWPAILGKTSPGNAEGNRQRFSKLRLTLSGCR